MKKHLFPIVAIAAICALSFGSCKKKSSSNTCTCKTKTSAGTDSTGSFSKADTGFTSLSSECTALDALEKATDGPNYGCHM